MTTSTITLWGATACVVDTGLFVLLALFVPLLCVLAAKLADAGRNERAQHVQTDRSISATKYYAVLVRNKTPVDKVVDLAVQAEKMDAAADAATKDPVQPVAAAAANTALLVDPPLCREAGVPTACIAAMGIFFAWLITLVRQDRLSNDSIMLLLGAHFYTIPLTGSAVQSSLLQSLEAMCFAYLGWFIWTVSTVFSRLVTLEIVLATYYNILARLVIAVFVGLLFCFLPGDITNRTLTADLTGFIVGFFPDTALTWLTTKLRHLLLDSDADFPEFPLNLVQGISGFRQMRLFEMGFDSCVNLGEANAIEMYLKSRLRLSEVVDWIGQAQLVVLAGKANFVKLQNNGYRTILDFKRGAGSPAAGFLQQLMGYTPEQLADIAAGLDDNPSFTLLKDMNGKLN